MLLRHATAEAAPRNLHQPSSDELQKLSLDEREKAVATKAWDRKQLRDKILDLSKKRDAFVLAARKKLASQNPAGFDAAVGEALKTQMTRLGER